MTNILVSMKESITLLSVLAEAACQKTEIPIDFHGNAKSEITAQITLIRFY